MDLQAQPLVRFKPDKWRSRHKYKSVICKLSLLIENNFSLAVTLRCCPMLFQNRYELHAVHAEIVHTLT